MDSLICPGKCDDEIVPTFLRRCVKATIALALFGDGPFSGTDGTFLNASEPRLDPLKQSVRTPRPHDPWRARLDLCYLRGHGVASIGNARAAIVRAQRQNGGRASEQCRGHDYEDRKRLDGARNLLHHSSFRPHRLHKVIDFLGPFQLRPSMSGTGSIGRQ
jgi:hypothetical protein